MEVEEYARIAAAEDDHWWYRNTRALMADLLRPWLGTEPAHPRRRLRPGRQRRVAREPRPGDRRRPGTRRAGVRARAPAGDRAGARPSASASRSPTRASTSRWRSRCSTPFRTTSRPSASWRGCCAPGGAVLLLEPAFASLRRAHDVTVHGLRRYRRDDLAGLAERAGLRVRRVDVRVLVPRPAGCAAGRARTTRVPVGRRHRAPTSSAARSTGCSRRWRRRSAAGWLATTSPSGRPSSSWRRGTQRAAADLVFPRRSTTSCTQSLARSHSVRATLDSLKNCDWPCDAGVVVDADLDEAGAGVLELAHELDADHPGRVLEPDPLEHRPAGSGGSRSRCRGSCSPNTNDTNRWYTRPIDPPSEVVGAAELVALHDVDVVRGPLRRAARARSGRTARHRRCRRPTASSRRRTPTAARRRTRGCARA